jgi:hypothetical protein
VAKGERPTILRVVCQSAFSTAFFISLPNAVDQALHNHAKADQALFQDALESQFQEKPSFVPETS